MKQSDKRRYIGEIQPGDRVDEVFVLAAKTLGHKKDGKPYLTLTLADKSGQVAGVVWDQVEQIGSAANAGDFVRVGALAGEYRGQLQLVVKSMDSVSAETVDPEDFLPATARDVEQMFDRLVALTDTLTTPHLKALLQAFWDDPDFVRAFKRSPAAKMMHHAYLGGLLQHTLSMALLAEKIAGHYTGVDRDLLLTGAVLHDIGKLGELSCDHHIDYTDEGRLLSHIIIGVEMVDRKIRTIEAFPPKLAGLVKHLVVSHHGSREFGSPEPPKTIEAVLLNYIDEIDARVNSIREFMSSEDPEAAWTSYHRLLERHFYKG